MDVAFVSQGKTIDKLPDGTRDLSIEYGSIRTPVELLQLLELGPARMPAPNFTGAHCLK